jgi:hypothetical protein
MSDLVLKVIVMLDVCACTVIFTVIRQGMYYIITKRKSYSKPMFVRVHKNKMLKDDERYIGVVIL